MKFRSILLTSLAVLGISGFGFGTIDAKASTDLNQTKESATVFSDDGLQSIKENQLKMGSNEETADKLIEKYKNGGMADADLMGFEDAVSSSTAVIGEITSTTYVFPDGSRAQATVDKTQSSAIQRIGISGGSCQTTSGGTECKGVKVSNKLAAYGYEYQVNYWLNRYGNDSIMWQGNPNIWMAGGTYASMSLRKVTPVNTTWDDEARLSAQLNVGGDVGSITRSLSFYVGNRNKTDVKWNSFY
ncbi:MULTISPECIES: hypothetical protein [unclassified Lysinibacillus]|uniref:hypothetical protein n=1 Tax=unclassified Lysinibacillus TaxID=2636778 RepID=UPI0035DDC311